MKTIPDRLESYRLIRVCRPDCRSHRECDHPGKRPVTSTEEGEPTDVIAGWVRAGGNYGIVPTENDDLLLVDADTEAFVDLVERELNDTFTVKTGGGGRHYYFRCAEAKNLSVKSGSEEYGSIRWDHWHGVGPGSTHPSGDDYYILKDTSLATVPTDRLTGFDRAVEKRLVDREDGGGGGGPAARPPSSRVETASDLSVSPSKNTLRTLGFINSDSRRREIAKVLDHSHPPRHVRVWAGGWLHSVAGLTEGQLERLFLEATDWATDRDRTEIEVRSLVRSSVTNPRASESVDLDQWLPDDDGGRGTPSEGDQPQSSTAMDYTRKEKVTVYNASSPEEAEDGDRVVVAELTNMKGQDENGSVDTDFVSFRKGTLREDGEFGVSPDLPDPQSSKSVGSADSDDLRLIAEALEQIADQLDD